MSKPHLLIIGGGLAGLAAGTYAQASGFQTTIFEHNLTLGGVCSAWRRGPYLVDGCLHWLTGGGFQRFYEELEILPGLSLKTIHAFETLKDQQTGHTLSISADLDRVFADLLAFAPNDEAELRRMREAAPHVAADFAVPMGVDEGGGLRETLRRIWDARDDARTLVHYRAPATSFLRQHIRSEQARRFLGCLLPEGAPALMGLWMLGSLEKGYLSRPIGGAAAFRERLEQAYKRRGGHAVVHATVDEVLVSEHRACGVRLANGQIYEGDAVLSTSSAPETVLRLLGGRYDAALYRDRITHWHMFTPIVIVSLGVERPYADAPQMMTLFGMEPFAAGGTRDSSATVRVFNDDPSFAPAGHTVVQALFESDYEWWARQGANYNDAKDAIARTTIEALAPFFPGLASSVRMVDVATPLTFWNMARSWRGAYEGWMPTSTSLFSPVRKTLAGLRRFVMAGQWVEPGGGIPTAILSGRQAIEHLCTEMGMTFKPTTKQPVPVETVVASQG